MLPYPIALSQVDAKSPVDDNLMTSIKYDLEYLDVSSSVNTPFDYEFKINGSLANLITNESKRRLDGVFVTIDKTLSKARLFLKKAGSSGDLEIDIRKYNNQSKPIKSLLSQYNGSINSITQVAPSISTQSISLFTPTIATQSVQRWKPTINISSITLMGNNLVRINLTSAIDADWIVGNSITISGAANAANNITTNIIKINDDGQNNIIITNALGVEQTTATGNIGLNKWAYIYVNPVVSNGFVSGESVVFSGHTNINNNGTFAIYAINQSGNNIIVENQAGIAQAAIAGSAQTTRWLYAFLAPVSSDFVVGESARMSSHTNALNNGDFVIRLLNFSGNNIIVSNNNGVAQGGAAGSANTTRWVYALPTDPSSEILINDSIIVSGATSSANNGVFVVKQVNRLSVNNVVVSNISGTTQAGASGTLASTKKIVTFFSDQSSVYSTESRIKIENTSNASHDGEFDVLEVNRGGGGNYNVVITNPTIKEQSSPLGRVAFESKSIFVNRLKLSLPSNFYNATNRDMQFVATTSSSDFNSNAVVVSGDILAAEFVSIPSGNPSDVIIQLS